MGKPQPTTRGKMVRRLRFCMLHNVMSLVPPSLISSRACYCKLGKLEQLPRGEHGGSRILSSSRVFQVKYPIDDYMSSPSSCSMFVCVADVGLGGSEAGLFWFAIVLRCTIAGLLMGPCGKRCEVQCTICSNVLIVSSVMFLFPSRM